MTMTDSATTSHAVEPEVLKNTLAALLGAQAQAIDVVRGELTLVVRAADYLTVMRTLRDAPQACFEQLVDLCGMDYQTYGEGRWEG